MQEVEQRRSSCQEAMDGNIKSAHKSSTGIYITQSRLSSRMRLVLHTDYHIPVFWIPAIPAGMTMIRFVQYLLSERNELHITVLRNILTLRTPFNGQD
jgi:hypothetical protein